MAVRTALALALTNLLLAGAMRLESETARNSGMVCCLKDEGTQLKVDLVKVLMADAGKLVKKTCILVAVPPESCESDGSALCKQRCVEKMEGNPVYIGLMQHKSRANYTSMQTEAHLERADALKQKEKVDALAQKALKDLQELEDLRNRTLVQRQTELQQAQKDFEDAEQANKEAAETLANLTSMTQEVERKAAIEEDQKQAEIEARVQEAHAKIDKIEAEKRKAEAQMREQGKSPPIECADEKYCCCSIRHNPVKVLTSQFTDWDECKNPKAYPKSASNGACKSVMVFCETCAALLCEDNGYGVCP
eukprot:TRINITY_DN33680_c0_g1_i1.p1 TRINITY_DN33680_c0_g1~~TRINITY_DN33680_c0_g1_i1.p1  ORF type:complete len:307 (+),score=88.66 TRINITY_DN33680_c0_g1_i1:79-999(+)